MSLTQHQLAIMLPEIASALDKGVVRKVYSDAHPDSILLEIRVPGANRWLAIHGDARASRLHLVEGKPSQPPMPDPFVMLLRKHLIGTRVTALTQLPNDRVIILHTQWRPGPDAAPDAQPASYQLVAELMGRRSLLLLLDADQLILGSLGPGRANDRDLRTGQPYTAPTPPPDRPNRDPWALAELTADGSRSRHLVRAYAEHLALAERKADTNRIQKRIRRQLKGLGRKEKAVSADLNRAEQAEQYRIWGELLQSAYGQVKRGATEVTVPNYYEPGAPALTIPLEPSRDLQENITWYFKRYRRYSGAIDTIEERLAAIWERLEALREAQQQAQALAQQALEPGPAHKDTPPEVARRELLALERDLEARRLLSAPQQQRS
ncbi:MAG: NFACT family protein, partial [Myxococcota bacterium]